MIFFPTIFFQTPSKSLGQCCHSPGFAFYLKLMAPSYNRARLEDWGFLLECFGTFLTLQKPDVTVNTIDLDVVHDGYLYFEPQLDVEQVWRGSKGGEESYRRCSYL